MRTRTIITEDGLGWSTLSTGIFFVLLATIAGLVSCKSPGNTTIDPNIAADFHVTLERTPCFGTCPAYTVQLFANGDVSYYGAHFVKDTGAATGHATTSSILELQNTCQSSGFFTMNSIYDDVGVTDCPWMYTTVTLNGTTKLIRDYACASSAPAALRSYEKLIDSLLNTKQWVGP